MSVTLGTMAPAATPPVLSTMGCRVTVVGIATTTAAVCASRTRCEATGLALAVRRATGSTEVRYALWLVLAVRTAWCVAAMGPAATWTDRVFVTVTSLVDGGEGRLVKSAALDAMGQHV